MAPCADLTQAPWGLAGKGLAGNRRLVGNLPPSPHSLSLSLSCTLFSLANMDADIGGEFNLFYHKNHANTFKFDECAKYSCSLFCSSLLSTPFLLLFLF